MRRHLLVALVLTVASLSACMQPSHDPVLRGRAFFVSYDCKKCHTVAGVGGTLGPDLTFVGFRKAPAFLNVWLKDPHAWKADVSMPNFHLEPQVRADLVSYLSSLQGQGYLQMSRRPWDAPEFASDPVKRGAEIYRLVGCVTCHNKDGKGGYPNPYAAGGVIPALTNVAEGYTREELVRKISEGVPHPTRADPDGPDPFLYMPSWGEKLTPDEIEAVADYLLSLKPKTAGADTW